ncbi:MAG: AmmeMemoRadiSam system protein B [Sedimentisphaerales bacterium]|nr:AmmeMemoRadiSam system protein B [Sedimentisphaerales bacterium]
MQTRKPIVAGQFYPASAEKCRREIEQCLSERSIETSLPETIAGGIVPHAGWVFSGSLAAMVFSAVKKQNAEVDTFVIFGAAHGYFGPKAAVYEKGLWQTPLGEIEIDEEIADLLSKSAFAVGDINAHAYEHSIEVQIPFIQHLFGEAKIVPVLTPPGDYAIEVGKAAAKIAKASGKKVVFIGSTDLTHYGPRYGFAPQGVGDKALEWASNVNDKKFIDAVLAMQPKEIISTSTENLNACGGGAAAATVAAACELGKDKAVLLAHTDSNTIMAEKMGQTSAESVGYAAIVF